MKLEGRFDARNAGRKAVGLWPVIFSEDEKRTKLEITSEK